MEEEVKDKCIKYLSKRQFIIETQLNNISNLKRNDLKYADLYNDYKKSCEDEINLIKIIKNVIKKS